MSIAYFVFCRGEPDIAATQSKWLTWNAEEQSGEFGGMYLVLERGDGIIARHELARPWPEPIVAVLRASGRLSDDTFDDFLDWSQDLARRARGAVMFEDGKLSYLWTDEAAVDARAQELVASRDFEALARLLHDTRERAVFSGDYIRVKARAWPALEDTIRRGEAIEVALELHAGVSGIESSPDSSALDEAILAAGQLPALANHGALQAAVERALIRRAWAERERTAQLAAGRPVPTEPAALARLIEEVASGDPVSIAILDSSATTRTPATYRAVVAAVADFARSGRPVAVAGMSTLASHGVAMFELDDEATRASFAACGELAMALVAKRDECLREVRAREAEYQLVRQKRLAQLAAQARKPKRR